MTDVKYRLDKIEKRVMSGLKDFQRATVNRIDHLYKNDRNRIMVSDEVGLGKTLIARGAIAKMAKLRKEENDDIFKVVYICSNAAIADQNLRKLRITREVKTESVLSSRLSMQHLTVFDQENDEDLQSRFIQLIPLTPDTSFRMTSGTGNVRERALMFVFLRRMPELRSFLPELEVAMTSFATKAWSWVKDEYENKTTDVNRKSKGDYFKYMREHLHEALHEEWEDGISYIEGLKKLCRAIRRNGGKRVSDDRIISFIRIIFAKISIEKLEPDFVIMDEFQRFRFMLDADVDSDIGMLRNKFFNNRNLRLLLLSATPYKMYSTQEEIEESNVDEHYEEFLSVMRFLNDDVSGYDDKFETIWKDYSVKLKEFSQGDTSILVAKNAAEKEMYKTVCRTERIEEPQNADIIDSGDVDTSLNVMEQDIKSYVQMQELLRDIGARCIVPVDYIKSTPYLMSFMRDYQLKRDIEKYFKKNPAEINKVKKDSFWINKNKINRYEKIPSNNARLEHVMEKVLEKNEDKILWMPPSKPYYEMEGAFKGAELSTKTLVFSSWEMVPRMIASMISYEAERRTVGKLAKKHRDTDARYSYEENDSKRYPPARLNFKTDDHVPASMTLFCLLYPSKYMTTLFRPIDCLNDNLSLKEIRNRLKTDIAKKLDDYPDPKTGRVDKTWYYIAPLMMDGEKYVRDWIETAYFLAEEDDSERAKQSKKSFIAHVNKLEELYDTCISESFLNLGRRPKDLADVLTDMALASPAVCINRTYKKYAGRNDFDIYYPTELAKIFIRRMNTPESIAAVELACGRKSDGAHWRSLLTYSVNGNLQAVFDEYAHLLAGGLDSEDVVGVLHEEMKSAINIRTTQYTVDTFNSFSRRVEGSKERAVNIRSHFAVAFTKGDGKDEDANRKKVVRNAFNSPFRPFVLATTSIGQEGLDFHNYCRRIVHWNLPSNPIDLEQREGRINRFKCLAIRQNIAERYGDIHFTKDIWAEMFDEAARVEKTDGASDIIPYWGIKEEENMVKIERIVPMYPYSKDEIAYDRLIKRLSLYRLTLGQARQEELLEYLYKNVDDTDELKKLFINLSPFYKNKKKP